MLCFYLAIPIRTISKNLPLRKVFLRSYPIGKDTIYLLSKKRMRKIKTYYEIFIKKFHIIQFLKYFFTYSPLLLVLIR